MRGPRNFLPGGVQARLPAENSSDDVFFFLFVLSFYSFTVAYQWFISKKTIILQGFRGGGEAFSRRVQSFPGGQLFSKGGGGGVQVLILETHRTFGFRGGGADPLSPVWIRTCDHLTTRH